MKKRKDSPSSEFDIERSLKRLKLELREGEKGEESERVDDDVGSVAISPRQCFHVDTSTQTECMVFTEAEVRRLLMQMQTNETIFQNDNFGQNATLNQVHTR